MCMRLCVSASSPAASVCLGVCLMCGMRCVKCDSGVEVMRGTHEGVCKVPYEYGVANGNGKGTC